MYQIFKKMILYNVVLFIIYKASNFSVSKCSASYVVDLDEVSFIFSTGVSGVFAVGTDESKRAFLYGDYVWPVGHQRFIVRRLRLFADFVVCLKVASCTCSRNKGVK